MVVGAKVKTKQTSKLNGTAKSEQRGSPGKSPAGNGSGIRIQAQRKFAQGQGLYAASTPSKENGKHLKRHRSPSPTTANAVPFPKCKRIKTEDFLEFLVRRGTDTLPPELDFTNCIPAELRPEEPVVKSVEGIVKNIVMKDGNVGNSKKIAEKGTELTSAKESERSEAIIGQDDAASSKSFSSSSSSSAPCKIAKEEQPSKFKKTKSKSSADDKEKSRMKLAKGNVSKKCDKRQKDVPETSRQPLNEQEAKFAMTALKLKYHEQRVSNKKSALSFLAKKAKDRIANSRILKTKNEQKKSIKGQSTEKINIARVDAPSPDIILGATEDSPLNKSSSFSESSSSNSESDRSSKEVESKPKEKMRWLRSGKEHRKTVLKDSKSNKLATKDKKESRPSIGTRAAHRKTNSPLRELPMYCPKRRNMIRRGALKSERNLRSPKKDRSGTGRSRPSRKTKENAAIYLGLLQKTFSSDSEGSQKALKTESASDSSDSSEAYLEKIYNDSLKREKEAKEDEKNRNRKSERKKSLEKTAEKDKDKNKRVLRSQVNHSPAPKPKKRVLRNAKPLPDSILRTAVGAARKSATVTPIKHTDSSSVSTRSSSSSKNDGSDSDSEADSDNSFPKKRLPLPKKTRSAVRKPTTRDSFTSSSEDEDDSPCKSDMTKTRPHFKRAIASRNSNRSQSSKAMKQVKTDVIQNKSDKTFETRKEPRSLTPKEISDKNHSSSSTTDSSDSEKVEDVNLKLDNENEREEETAPVENNEASNETNSTTSETSSDDDSLSPPPIKVDIAIQVDMDCDSDAEKLPDAIPSPPNTMHPATSSRCSSTSTTRDTSVSPSRLDTTTPGMASTSSTQSYHESEANSTTPTAIPSTGYCPEPQIPHIDHFPSYSRPTYYPSINLAGSSAPQHTPINVMNSIHVVEGTQHFSNIAPHPQPSLQEPSLGAMPLNIPLQSIASSARSHMLNVNPLGFASPAALGATTGATFHQTHIRTVTTNMELPLVRPVAQESSFLISRTQFQQTACPPTIQQMGFINRPMPPVWPQIEEQAFSAFRVPVPNVPSHAPPASKATHGTVMPGINPLIPLSIVPTQTVQPGPIPNPQPLVRPPTTASVSYNSLGSSGIRSMGTKLQGASAKGKIHFSSVGGSIPKSNPGPSGHNFVSIVPRYNRNSKPAVPPPQISKASTKESYSTLNKNRKNAEKSLEQRNAIEKKHIKQEVVKNQSETKDKSNSGIPACTKGRKRKHQVPKPMSPLTVRKDHNAATYAKKNGIKVEEEKVACEVKKEADDPFNKLLERKGSELNDEAFRKMEACKDEEILGAFSSSESQESHGEVTVKTETMDIAEIPIFRLTEAQFNDPLQFITSIAKTAEVFGMAKIIPPKSFRPECNIRDEIRFNAYAHYIHKLFDRWGPNCHETVAIKEHCRKLDVDLSANPSIGGIEINLSDLYRIVQSFGGGNEVIEKQKWLKVADALNIPKAAHDRASKLDAIYLKYVLPFEMLSKDEREKLMKQVEEMWKQRQDKLLLENDSSCSDSSDEDIFEELDECIVKGKSTSLASYYRWARNTCNMFFKSNDPQHEEVEEEYWKIVKQKKQHVCVHSGSIDCSDAKLGFQVPEESKPETMHPWNLKMFTRNCSSILKSLGSVVGVTVPTLHLGMLFSTYCWYRDPHCLPWIEYLHDGADKIWYSIPESEEEKFHNVVKELMPLQCKKKNIWLASDSVMVPPEVLLKKGISVAKTVQKPREFVVVFQKAFTCSISTGYLVSENVSFCTKSWLNSCLQIFKDIKQSQEPPAFAIENLLLNLVRDESTPLDVIKLASAALEKVLKSEQCLRKKLLSLGIKHKKLRNEDIESRDANGSEDDTLQCDVCNYILYLSAVMIKSKTVEKSLCLTHGVDYLASHKSHVKYTELLFDMSDNVLSTILKTAQQKTKNQQGK